MDDNAKYELELKLKHYGCPHYYKFLLSWKVHSPEEDIWVPEANLEHAHEILTQYKA